jgi:hypothetical protein
MIIQSVNATFGNFILTDGEVSINNATFVDFLHEQPTTPLNTQHIK